MGLFDKKPSRDDIIAQGQAAQVAEAEAASSSEKKDEQVSSGNAKLDMEIVKIKAQLESFGEIRKANSERFGRIGEQIGEIRGMVMDTNKTISKIEVSATKAIDLVESVQPEKLMIELRKMDGKIESLRANIESNEAMMRDLMEELKKMRAQMNFYKGIEQVAKLNEEVKQEILDIKKIEATIERHADKGETIFLDMEKKFAEYEKFQAKIQDLDAIFHNIQVDFDKIKLGISNKSDKKDFVTLISKFSEFEKHTSEVLKLLDERNKQSKTEIKEAISKMKKVVAKKHGIMLEELESVGSEIKELPNLEIKRTTVEMPKEEEKPAAPEKAPEKAEAPAPKAESTASTAGELEKKPAEEPAKEAIPAEAPPEPAPQAAPAPPPAPHEEPAKKAEPTNAPLPAEPKKEKKNGQIETDAEKLFAIVSEKKRVSIADAAKALGTSVELVKEWVKFLENEGDIEVEETDGKSYLKLADGNSQANAPDDIPRLRNILGLRKRASEEASKADGKKVGFFGRLGTPKNIPGKESGADEKDSSKDSSALTKKLP